MSTQVPEDGRANMLEEDLRRSAAKVRRLELSIVFIAGVAVLATTLFSVFIGLGNREVQSQIKDCQTPTGRCYQRTAKTTGAAIQTILNYIDATMSPHRLRNEADHHCILEADRQIAVDIQGRRVGPIDKYEETFDDCALRRSGNTPAPPVPQLGQVSGGVAPSRSTTGGHP